MRASSPNIQLVAIQGPAKYEFEYEVNDQEFGVEFGHKESRDGDLAMGEYNVLLPDGRKQRVEYEADGEGYRPKITYEGRETNWHTNWSGCWWNHVVQGETLKRPTKTRLD